MSSANTGKGKESSGVIVLPVGTYIGLHPEDISTSTQKKTFNCDDFSWDRAFVLNAVSQELSTKANPALLEFFNNKKHGPVPLNLLHWFVPGQEHVSLLLGPVSEVPGDQSEEMSKAVKTLQNEAFCFFAQHNHSMKNFTLFHHTESLGSESCTVVSEGDIAGLSTEEINARTRALKAFNAALTERILLEKESRESGVARCPSAKARLEELMSIREHLSEEEFLHKRKSIIDSI